MSNAPYPTKRIVGIIGGVIGFIIAYIVVRSLFSPSFEEHLQSVEKRLNRDCPEMLDEYTRLDSAVVPKGTRNLQYYYTITGFDQNEVDYDELKGDLERSILEMIKTSSDLKYLKDNDVIFDYIYYDENRNKVITINVVPAQYN